MSEVIGHTLFTNTFEQGVRVNSHQQKALLVVRVTEAHAVGGFSASLALQRGSGDAFRTFGV